MTREGNFLKTLFPALAFILLAAAGAASPVRACRAAPFTFGRLFAAEVIVRATAVRYAAPPGSKVLTSGVPDSTVEFRVEETLKGAAPADSLVLDGHLSDRGDFSESRVPYKSVREGGRRGRYVTYIKKWVESYERLEEQR